MALDVHLFPCLSDNYGFLVRDPGSGRVATIDSPDPMRIMEELERLGWGRLHLILNTHWHADHTQGNTTLQAAFGCEIAGPEEVRRLAPLDRVLSDGDVITLGKTRMEVVHTPGHTLGHIVYRAPADGLAFVGDVIFALGCGRLFEGTPEQMWSSLRTIAAWPDETLLYCAHEYTASNARFALSLSEEGELAAHAASIFKARDRGEPTVPTTVGIERRFNPFVTATDAARFAERRTAKDSFRG